MSTIMKTMLLTLMALTVACGDDNVGETGTNPNEGREPEPLVEQAKFSIASAEHTADDGEYTLYKTPQCQRDANTGVLTMNYSHLGTTLAIEIKNFSSSPKVYTCEQPENNATSVDSVGDRYTGCMVSMRLNNINEELNGYDMFRANPNMTLFRYNDSCRIDVTESGLSVRGTFSCGSVPQTFYDGLRRNPVDPGNNADISGSFGCDLE